MKPGVVQNREVYVIGAGVAGLTAAHELAERGFKVFIYDSAVDPRRPDKPAIGGMARTQWTRVPVEQPVGGAPPLPQDMVMISALPFLPILQDIGQNMSRLADSQLSPWPELYFAKGSADLDDKPDDGGVLGSPERRLRAIAAKCAGYLRQAASTVQASPALGHWCESNFFDEINFDGTISAEEPADQSLDAKRMIAVIARVRDFLLPLLNDGANPAGRWKIDPIGSPYKPIGITYKRQGKAAPYKIATLNATAMGSVHAGERVRVAWQQRYVRISMRPKLLPGEHGYRLFPRFYSHLLDTLRRTPLLAARSMSGQEFAEMQRDQYGADGIPKDDVVQSPTGRSAFDQLIAVTEQDFAATGSNGTRRLPRFRGESLADLIDVLDMLQKDQGWTNSDLLLVQLKFLQYATSSPARRASYEAISWAQFLRLEEAGRFSECFRRSMRNWPQALIGLRAEKIDARTFGSTALQQFIDQLQPIGYRDGTLNGPTTTAWLDHWQLYLEHLGVTFKVGRLDRLELRGAAGHSWLVPIFDPKYTPALPAVAERGAAPIYIVLALPVEKAWEIAGKLETSLPAWARSEWERSDFPALRSVLDDTDSEPPTKYSPSWLDLPDPPGPLQNFAGIQFFLDEDYRFVPGYLYYPNAAWGLTSISQTRFRQDQAANRYKFRGEVSVVIGAWDIPGTEIHKKPARRCTDHELADECWAQMTAGMAEPKPSMPLWFHVDYNVPVVTEPHGIHRHNDSPYLTTAPGRFSQWPGKVGDYRVQFGNLVLAGTYLQTYTRLVTMEAANESARHAVNAILQDWTAHRSGLFVGPEIWNPEDRELRDLDYLKRIDARLYEEGLPHAFEILLLDKTVMADRASNVHPTTLIEAFSRVAWSQGRALTAFIERVRSAITPTGMGGWL